jgi:Icc-related predicted phosphoesterase
MKFVYASDLHGNAFLYKQLKKLIETSEEIDYLLLGGDLFAHTRELKDQIHFVNGYFKEFLGGISAQILFIPGNIDWPGAIDAIHKLADDIDIREVNLSGFNIGKNITLAGYPFVIPSPLHRKDYEMRDLESDELHPVSDSYISDIYGLKTYIRDDYFNEKQSMETDLDKINPDCNILISHSPPFGGNLDMCHTNNHIGSKAVRNKIAQLQPCLSLHGHVHESPEITGKWFDMIGNTVCINAGMNTIELHAVAGELDDDSEIVSLQHTIYGHYK